MSQHDPCVYGNNAAIDLADAEEIEVGYSNAWWWWGGRWVAVWWRWEVVEWGGWLQISSSMNYSFAPGR